MSDIFDKIKSSADFQPNVQIPVEAWNEFQAYQKGHNENGPILWSRIIPLSLFGLLLISSILWWSNKNNNLESVSSYARVDTVYVDRIIETFSETQEKTRVAEADLTASTSAINKFHGNSYLTRNQRAASEQALITIQRLERKVNELINKVDHLESDKVSTEKKVIDLLTQRIFEIASRSDDELIGEMNNELSYLEFIDYLNAFPVDNGIDNMGLIQPDPMDYNKDYKNSVRSFLKPDYYSVGLNSGFNFGTNQKYGKEQGYNVGIEGSAYFNSNIRLNGNVNFSKTTSKVNNLGDYDDIPEPEQPQDGTLSYLVVNNQSLLYALSLDYIFSPKNKIRPYLGLGFAHKNNNYRRFDFEYFTPSSEVYLQVESKGNITQSNNLSINVGVDMDISKNMYLKLNSTVLGTLEYNRVFYYLTPGINYRF